MKKLFVVRKLVYARDIADALRLEKKQKPDDIWVDEEWKKMTADRNFKDMGFNTKKKKNASQAS